MTIPSDFKLLGRKFDGGNIYFVYVAGAELLNVQITDGAESPLLVDDFTDDRILAIINSPHHENHEGNHYEASYKSPDGADVGDNDNLDILIVTGAQVAHMVWDIGAGGDAEVFHYEGVTTSDNGTLALQANTNRLSVNTAVTIIYHTPTISNLGTQLPPNSYLPGGTGGNAGGGTRDHDVEWILKKNTKYLLRVTNRSGQAQPIGTILQWYEP